MNLSDIIDKDRIKDYYVIRERDNVTVSDIFIVVDLLNNYRYVVNNDGKVIASGERICTTIKDNLIKNSVCHHGRSDEVVLDKDGRVLVRGGCIKIIDKNLAVKAIGKKYKLVSLGENIIKKCCKYSSVFLLNDFYGVEKNKKYGVVDKRGMIIVKIKYDNVIGTNSNIYIYKKSGMYGLVNNSGYEITENRFNIINELDKNLFLVNEGGFFGLIDNLGRYLIKPSYFYIDVFDNLIVALKGDGYFDVYDKNCEFKYSLESDGIEEYNNIKRLYKNDCYRYLDKDNNDIFNRCFSYGSNVNGNTMVVQDNKNKGYYLVNSSGEKLTEEYDWIQYFAYGYYVITKDNRKGLVDSLGNKLFDNLYDGIICNVNGVVLKKDKKDIYCSYDKSKISNSYDSIGKFSNGLSVVKNDNKFGVIDSEGNEVISPCYFNVLLLSNGNIYADGNVIKRDFANINVKKKILV